MKDYKIYLSGGMMKFGTDNFEEGDIWRQYCKSELEICECNYNVKVFNPNSYFSFKHDTPTYDSEAEVMHFDIHNLRKSDLVIVNYNDKWSLGTMAEIAIAYERNIPVIGLNSDNQELHPWQKCMCERVFNNIDKMIEYIKDFYLN